MRFPPGRLILLVLLMALTGAAILLGLRSPSGAGGLHVWVFDPTHLQAYTHSVHTSPSLVAQFTQETGHGVEVELLPSRVLDARLLSLTLADTRGRQVPDLVEIEIGSVGKFFRAAPEKTGLLPLERFLASDPAAGQLLPARLATWTFAGHLYGIPRDIHPVSITFRRDLFKEAGVDLAACATWPQFREACLAYQNYHAARGHPRLALQLARWNASDLLILLYQQRIELFDTAGRPRISDPRIAATVAFYASLVAGPQPIAQPVTAHHFVDDLADGHTGALLTPDWRIAYLRDHPGLLGKLQMMPLPRFSPADAPTASWGGTMVAIPQNCADPQLSWQLLRQFQLSPAAMRARAYYSNILPAIRSAWSDPAWHQADPLFGDQRIGEVYIALGEQLPPQRSSPYATLLSQTLASVLSSAQMHLATYGTDDLAASCQEQLDDSQRTLDRLMEFEAGARPPATQP